jgi:hypothetical protein
LVDASLRKRITPLPIRAIVILAALLTGVLAGRVATDFFSEGESYAHVFELIFGKLRYAGVLPADPDALSFGARILWQGPFRTSSIPSLVNKLAFGLAIIPIALPFAAVSWWKGEGDSRRNIMLAFSGAILIAGVLMSRMVVLVGLLTPVVAVMLLQMLPKRTAVVVAATVGTLQLALFANKMIDYRNNQWHHPIRRDMLARVVTFVRDELPANGAIATDFVTATALLSHTGHPVVLQPKYETARSRDRIETFFTSFYGDSPEAFKELLIRDFKAQYLLIDVPLLWGARYQAGYPMSLPEPPPGSASAELMSPSPAIFGSIPGYRLLYSDTEELPIVRLYELEGGPSLGAVDSEARIRQSP